MSKHFRFHDGGRTAAGYRGKTGDCVVRSIAIATGLPYQQIYDLVNRASVHERTGTRKRGKSNARTGVYKSTIRRLMNSLGWVWTPTMQIGSGCTVHLRPDELPRGPLVVSVSKASHRRNRRRDPRHSRLLPPRHPLRLRLLATRPGPFAIHSPVFFTACPGERGTPGRTPCPHVRDAPTPPATHTTSATQIVPRMAFRVTC
jgi:hypothetical protein